MVAWEERGRMKASEVIMWCHQLPWQPQGCSSNMLIMDFAGELAGACSRSLLRRLSLRCFASISDCWLKQQESKMQISSWLISHRRQAANVSPADVLELEPPEENPAHLHTGFITWTRVSAISSLWRRDCTGSYQELHAPFTRRTLTTHRTMSKHTFN